MMKFRAVVYAAMLVAPGLAAAQMPLPSLEPAPPLNGLYIGAGAGLNWLQNQHLINAAGTAGNAALQSRYGWAGVGSVGYALPNGLRFEIEGDYRTISSLTDAILAFRLARVAEKLSTARCSTCSTI